MKVVKKAKDLKLPREEAAEDYKMAIGRYKQWKEDY